MKSIYTVHISDHEVARAVLGEFEDGYCINRVNVPVTFRGKGHASTLLRKILFDADFERKMLYLFVQPSGGLDFEELVRWYGRHGFLDCSTMHGYMIRQPKEGYYPNCKRRSECKDQCLNDPVCSE